MIKLQQADLDGKRVLIRADLNVSAEGGNIRSDRRIQASLETIKYVTEANGAALVISHYGRPKEGCYEEKFSLKPIARRIEQLLNCDVLFLSDWLSHAEIKPGQIAVGENVRFLQGEKTCSDDLSRRMAEVCDVFVLDAFGAAHRSHASLTGVVNHVDTACLGLLCQHELDSLKVALDNPESPVISIVGGAKIEGKLQALRRLAQLSSVLIVGGGIANTFLAARGVNVGRSLYEVGLIDTAREIMDHAKRCGCSIPLPVDVVVAPSLSEGGKSCVKGIDETGDEDMIFDIGPRTRNYYCDFIQKSKTIIWNGPVGVFETPPFDAGTRAIVECVTKSSAFSAAGGGDTITALEEFGKSDQVSYISTGGGAFLEIVQGNTLPAFAALEQHAQRTANQWK